MPRLKVLTLLSLATLFAPAFAQGPNTADSTRMNGLNAGAVTYVQGQVAVDGTTVTQQQLARMPLKQGSMLSTGNGRAELSVAPGAYLRLDSATSIKLVATGSRTEVEIDKGRAELAVRNMAQGVDLQIDTPGGVQTIAVKDGLYEFDTKAGQLKVFDGKAAVSAGANAKWIDVKGGHELALNGTATKPAEFNEQAERADLASFSGPGASYGGGYYGRGYAAGGYGAAYYGDGDYGYPAAYAYPYPFFGGYGFYGPYAYGFYPGFYGGFGFGGFYGGGFRGGYGGFRGGFRR